MASDLSNILPKILARALLSLRSRCTLIGVVNSDYSSEAAEKGDTIDVPISSVKSTPIAVVPASVPPTPVDSVPSKVQIQLNNWYQNPPFYLTDRELVQIDKDRHFIPIKVSEAVEGLASFVNQQIFQEYKGIFGFQGTPGTTPFGTPGTPLVTDVTKARAILNRQKCPKKPRWACLDFDAEAALLSLGTISDAEHTGTPDVKMEGEIGHKFGVDWYADDDTPTHTAGTAASYVTNGIQAIGATSIVLGTGTGTLVVGDIITFAGHTQTYVVTAGIAAPGTAVINPGLKVQVASAVAVTSKASHVVNIMAHRDAFAFATRPLLQSTTDLQLGSEIVSLQDPVSGLVLRLEVSRQHKQTAWEFDLLWGQKLVRPELAMRIAG